MPKPKPGDKVTQGQIDAALNIGRFKGSLTPDPKTPWQGEPGRGGLFEPWSKEFGYKDGFPLCGGVVFDNEKIHIYYLPTKKKTILLKAGETPEDYDVNP